MGGVEVCHVAERLVHIIRKCLLFVVSGALCLFILTLDYALALGFLLLWK